MQMEIDQWTNKLDLIFILFDIREHATTTNVPHTPQHVHVTVECEQEEETNIIQTITPSQQRQMRLN